MSQGDTQPLFEFPNMPAFKKRKITNKKTFAKKTTNVRKIWPFASKGLGPMWDPFPARAKAILRYSDNILLAPTAGTPAPNLFRCNSIFDPDFTNIGHQPYGHDTYATIYNQYKVVSSTITMTPVSSSSGSNGVYGICLTDDSTVSSDYNTVKEMKGTKMAPITQVGSGAKSVTNYFSKYQQFANNQLADSVFGANPTQQSFFHCWYEGPDDSTAPTSVRFLISISYIVEMWDLKQLIGS